MFNVHLFSFFTINKQLRSGPLIFLYREETDECTNYESSLIRPLRVFF